MVDELRLPKYSAKSVREGRESYIVDRQGLRLPSVTTILNATKPQAAREALMRWRDRLGATEAQRVTSNASRRGTQTHKYLRQYLIGEAIACPDPIRPYWDSLQAVLHNVQDVRLVEGYVFHYDLGYAGKVDCIASYNGIPCVFDWKTADAPKGSIERLYDGPLQLAAYCGAINHSYADHNIHLRHAALIVAVPDHPAEVFWLTPDQLRPYWQHWQNRLTEYYRTRKIWRKHSEAILPPDQSELN